MLAQEAAVPEEPRRPVSSFHLSRLVDGKSLRDAYCDPPTRPAIPAPVHGRALAHLDQQIASA